MIIIKKEIIPTEIFTNITTEVQSEVTKVGVQQGICMIYSKHTTTCIRLLENETLLKLDEKDFFERLASSNCLYRHDDLDLRDVGPEERRNGYSHLRALLLNHQEIVPIVEGKLDLGIWQQIFYIECDLGKTDRTYNILVMEEK